MYVSPNRPGVQIPAGQKCFMCGKQLGGRAIVWDGETRQTIYLHVDCAPLLAANLQSDFFWAKHGGFG